MMIPAKYCLASSQIGGALKSFSQLVEGCLKWRCARLNSVRPDYRDYIGSHGRVGLQLMRILRARQGLHAPVDRALVRVESNPRSTFHVIFRPPCPCPCQTRVTLRMGGPGRPNLTTWWLNDHPAFSGLYRQWRWRIREIESIPGTIRRKLREGSGPPTVAGRQTT